MKKVIFWDFDGTLVQANRSFFDSLQYGLEQENIVVSEDVIMDTLKTACSWHMANPVYPMETGAAWWRSLFAGFAKLYDHIDLPQMCRDRVNARFRARILDSSICNLYDEALDVLRTCRDLGYDNYIISNNFPELPMIVAELGLSAYILETFASANIGYDKPHREIFEYALSRANHPEICYMIGDNPIADIEGGKSVGMKTILVHSPVSCDSCALRDVPSILL